MLQLRIIVYETSRNSRRTGPTAATRRPGLPRRTIGPRHCQSPWRRSLHRPPLDSTRPPAGRTRPHPAPTPAATIRFPVASTGATAPRRRHQARLGYRTVDSFASRCAYPAAFHHLVPCRTRPQDPQATPRLDQTEIAEKGQVAGRGCHTLLVRVRVPSAASRGAMARRAPGLPRRVLLSADTDGSPHPGSSRQNADRALLGSTRQDFGDQRRYPQPQAVASGVVLRVVAGQAELPRRGGRGVPQAIEAALAVFHPVLGPKPDSQPVEGGP